jgi:hypothetical protein
MPFAPIVLRRTSDYQRRFAARSASRDTAGMRFPRRRSSLTSLDEAAAYARCHGSRENDVRIVKLPPRRPRYEDVLTTGEELRVLFEQRLDAREPDAGEDHAKAGSEEPAPAPLPPAV